MDSAFGVEYLLGKNIVHFDLKCENILVNMRDPQLPIGDLGLPKVKQKTLVSGDVRGTLPWMAHELLSGKSNVSLILNPCFTRLGGGGRNCSLVKNLTQICTVLPYSE
ncbi:hypothetical protein F2Q68_00021989 [Brassica cretica]|uniref:Protein kinase domain-containing protein n=1 Tax=Brassica cretica TaxID=69181 RepID=A0A8S9G3G0_BRACR|nr:hypothetical protein F2Q68_00021989 [Brassica cretica]